MSLGRRALGWLGGSGAALLDLVLPDVCAACHAEESLQWGLCEACHLELLKLVALPYCSRCGSGLPEGQAARPDGCLLCPQPLPRYEQVVRLGPYVDPLRGVIRELKYRRQDRLRCRLGWLLGQAVAGRCAGAGFDVVLPVPMHWRRRLLRGQDHARVLARAVGAELRLPVGDELARTRATPPQAHLPRVRRLANVRGAFAVARPEGVEGARVLLVDDVTTTGATAGEAAAVLLRAGAAHVTLAVVCKSEPSRLFAHADASLSLPHA